MAYGTNVHFLSSLALSLDSLRLQSLINKCRLATDVKYSIPCHLEYYFRTLLYLLRRKFQSLCSIDKTHTPLCRRVDHHPRKTTTTNPKASLMGLLQPRLETAFHTTPFVFWVHIRTIFDFQQKVTFVSFPGV
jgi:hypothetical protein